jgi:hypothetical protein
MRRFLVPLLVGVFFLIPATSWSKSDSPEMDARVTELEAQVASLKMKVADLQTQLTTAQTAILGLEQAASFAMALKDYVTVDLNVINGLKGPHVIFSGVNVHIRDGSGRTDDLPNSTNGLGNLIVGYNEMATFQEGRGGSHNLVVGPYHTYTSYGGFVAGAGNIVSGPWASVSGGCANTASGDSGSSVSGGAYNTAHGPYSSVSGGSNNTAKHYYSSVSGGSGNIATALYSSVSGGSGNSAGDPVTYQGSYSTVSGGSNNKTTGEYSVVSGGTDLTASEMYQHLP